MPAEQIAARACAEQTAGWFSYVAYPLLLLGNGGLAFLSLHCDLPLGPMTFLSVLGSIAYLALVECIIPYRRDWRPTPREWGRDGIYFVSIMLAGGLAQAITSGAFVSLAHVGRSLSLWLETPLALLVSTLSGYWFHRLGHSHRWFWKVHGVHHVPTKVNLGNNNVVHFLDPLGGNLAVGIPLLLLGFSAQAAFLSSVLVAALGYGVHSNADVRLGWFNHILCGPELHRLHHSIELEEAGHYSADLPLWDLVFGTFTWRSGRHVAAVGVRHPEEFPPSSALLANELHPFVSAASPSPP